MHTPVARWSHTTFSSFSYSQLPVNWASMMTGTRTCNWLAPWPLKDTTRPCTLCRLCSPPSRLHRNARSIVLNTHPFDASPSSITSATPPLYLCLHSDWPGYWVGYCRGTGTGRQLQTRGKPVPVHGFAQVMCIVAPTLITDAKDLANGR
ncbi:hypothetical protein EDB86DRAFT_2985929 [Lactarius hatsudake]|nr:hypothetical protein EDB86DRAFT_2994711 [Lactarius hatsudake]KAH8979372.1 hypothetical protein EDB86DRAFT_2985929 [Lactarius hatsudake]